LLDKNSAVILKIQILSILLLLTTIQSKGYARRAYFFELAEEDGSARRHIVK
jgi:hypothetical protein